MERPYRILHLITALSVGGVQNQLAKVVSSYDRPAFSPSVCCLSHKGEIGDELERMGVEVKALGSKAAGFSPKLLWRLFHLLRAERIAVLRPHKYRSALYGVLAGRMAKVPVIIPSFHLPQAIRKAKRRSMIRFLSRMSDEVVAVSQAVAENLTEGIGVPRSKIRVIHNGVDLREFENLPSKEQAQKRVKTPPDAWVIGGIGRMKAQKGFGNLLSALPLLEEKGLRNYWVMMVGDGDLRVGLERQALQSGCEEKVKFLGVRRDIPQLLRAMDVFVFPSLWEGFGTALLEAMAAQVPIVASDLPCVREIIPDERYGSLVPPGEVGALAEAILGIWRNGKPWETRVIAAKDRAIQDFSLARVVSTYQDLYQEILSRKAPDGHP